MPRRRRPGPPGHTAQLVVARLLFFAACFVVGYGVFAPPGKGPPLLPWDKAEHFIAFFGLMVLALPAFPRTRPWILAAALILAGAAVEFIQATPLIHRDADVRDWAADSLGILTVVGVVLVARIRRTMAER